jgi:hypothetical protein
MDVIFDAGGTKCPLGGDEARRLGERLRTESTPHGAGSVVATKIERILAAKTKPELRLLNYERNAIAGTISNWLDDVGFEGIPEGIMRLRYALDAETRIDIGYRSGIYRLPRHQAIVLAENLRVEAAKEGSPTAGREIADQIEDVLVGASDEPIRLSDAQADVVFAALSVSLEERRSPLVAEAYSLYMAILDRETQG